MYPENSPAPQPLPNPVPPQASDWLPPSPELQPVKPPHKSKVWLIFVGIAVLLTTGIAIFLYATTQNTPTCLTTSDYETLSGETLPAEAPFTPTIDFYGFDVNFKPDASGYAEDTTLAQLKAVGTLHQQQPDTSMLISLEAMYIAKGTTSTQALVSQRIETITAALVSAGMKPEQITSSVKQYVEEPYGDSFTDTDVVTLSLASATGCR